MDRNDTPAADPPNTGDNPGTQQPGETGRFKNKIRNLKKENTAAQDPPADSNDPPQKVENKKNANQKCAMDCMVKPGIVASLTMGQTFDKMMEIHEKIAKMFAILIE